MFVYYDSEMEGAIVCKFPGKPQGTPGMVLDAKNWEVMGRGQKNGIFRFSCHQPAMCYCRQIGH